MSDIEIGSEWIWTNADGEVVVEVIDVATNEHGETIVTTEEDDGEIQYDDIDYFLASYKPKADMVNHPPHYKDASGIECIEVTKHMSFLGGNCFKYLYRAGSKGDAIEDLKKAAWYAEQAWFTEEVTDIRLVDNIIKIAEHRNVNIADAMYCIYEDMWADVKKAIEDEIARLYSEANDD